MKDKNLDFLNLLTSTNQQFSFSLFCRSGILKSTGCECWRCREQRGLKPDEELASFVAAGADLGFNFRIQEERLEQNGENSR